MPVAGTNRPKFVYRLRGIPASVNSLDGVRDLLEERFADLEPTDVDIQSLATSLNYWERLPSKVATLKFKKYPAALGTGGHSWDLPIGGNRVLVLDHDFLGLTPLNDVDEAEHVADCIAISGLGSHPFGSWQPHGPQKDFMWIRDEAPALTPGVRMLLYGHDSSLLRSHSFQLISDIARDLIEHLMLGGWSQRSAKPLLFLAHSLGDLILKDALVQIADERNQLNANIKYKIQGAIFFGVPNLGMEQAHLLAMVEGQPNETLIQDLSRNSNYLLRLNDSFSGTTLLSKITTFWAYELLQSHTVVPSKSGQGWDRDGPLAILVSPDSATCRMNRHNPSATFPINSNHSDMVKFWRDQAYTKMICAKLFNIAHGQTQDTTRVNHPEPQNLQPNMRHTIESNGLKLEGISKSLDAPNLHFRQEAIDDNFDTTFEWVFEHDGFVKWLSNEDRMFWINGKPGSGKSTLMKFVLRHKRTTELLHDWKSKSPYTAAGFFFHYRGSYMQKSFEGVLRSLLLQILNANPALCPQLEPFFGSTSDPRAKQWTQAELERALHGLLTQEKVPLKLCLFFDALDEFDGHPQKICRFLLDLIIIPGPSCIKVCFSSRPWDIFKRVFSDYPNFSLQDHTQTDIQNYCMSMIVQTGAPIRYLEVLVPAIVQRASGVFLWVSLVVKDLSHAILDPERDTGSLEELQAILNALPLELDSYYREIVRRVPMSRRWETYVLLELIIRQLDKKPPMSLDYTVRAIAASRCHTYQEALEALQPLGRQRDEQSTLQLDESSYATHSKLIYLWGGGLVDVKVKARPIGASFHYVEVMHQTVFEFVTSLEFKEVVLGQLAKITHENGHVFHMKYLFAESREAKDIGRYAREAESITGTSQARYISSIPDKVISSMFALVEKPRRISPKTYLGFAAWASLILFIRQLGENALKTWRLPVDECLVDMSIAGTVIFPVDVWIVTQALVEKGYDAGRDDALGGAFRTFKPMQPSTNTSNDCPFDINAINMWTGFCTHLLDHNYPTDRRVELDFGQEWHLPLHLWFPATVIEKLLDKGADPNAENWQGCTPLDAQLLAAGDYYQTIEYESLWWMKESYRAAWLLIQHGGKLKTVSSLDHTFRMAMRRFREALEESEELDQVSLLAKKLASL